jgi:hypothetical protein
MGEDTLLSFVQNELQIVVLIIFGTLYAVKAYQISRRPAPPQGGVPRAGILGGVAKSYGMTFVPWMMESSRTHLGRWLEYAVYHLGAGSAIAATFLFPFAPSWMVPWVRYTFLVFIALASVVGVIKIVRRFTRPELRVISTLDDYFSLISLEIWLLTAIPAMTLNRTGMIVFFIITAGFLLYVPFSKISHYVYWFFARFLFGVKFGRRGVVPRSGGA